ncbi:MAG TPA: DUF58 domain-containing protein [Terriglobia bacterium]|nr:DUF58 domain-containing protein [Terriglobia bacterium]
MATAPQPLTGSFWQDVRAMARNTDRPGWRRFFLALFGLTFSFFLALYSTALREAGNFRLGAAVAVLSLLVAGFVALKTVPFLARRTSLDRWMVKIEYELTREGLVYLGVIAVIVIAALNTGNNLLFMVLASLLAGILVSGILSKIVLSGLEIDFTLPEHIFAGDPVAGRLELRNRKWLFPSFSVTISIPAPAKGRHARSAVDPAAIGLADARALPMLPTYLAYIPRRASAVRPVELAFARRGRYTQQGFRIGTKFPFGLLGKRREAPLGRDIIALPSVQPTEEFYEILPLLTGELESDMKGRGHDLYAIRDYQESDSARHVDWKATAKACDLKVREFTREDERRVVLVFDSRLAAADQPSLAKFEKAVNFCACLAWHFYEINAQMEFVTDGFVSGCGHASETVYPALEKLALIEPRLVGLPGPSGPSGDDVLSRLGSGDRGFHIILTSQPRGSIPTHLWGSSYMVFFDSL